MPQQSFDQIVVPVLRGDEDKRRVASLSGLFRSTSLYLSQYFTCLPQSCRTVTLSVFLVRLDIFRFLYLGQRIGRGIVEGSGFCIGLEKKIGVQPFWDIRP